MNELQKRIATAVVLVVLAGIWMFAVSDTIFVMLTALIGFAVSLELFRLMKLSTGWVYTLISALLFTLLAQTDLSLAHILIIALACWLVPFLLSSAHASQQYDLFYQMLSTLFMLLWLLAFTWSLIYLHALEYGIEFLCGCFLGIWASDSGAYFVGKKWGKNKLCPSVSPGKSWEGFAGGLVAGVLIASVFWVGMIQMPLMLAVMLAGVLVVLGVLGDLFESALKRSVGAKDSGTILPGHGGVLDRLDSVITAIPVTTTIWILLS